MFLVYLVLTTIIAGLTAPVSQSSRLKFPTFVEASCWLGRWWGRQIQARRWVGQSAFLLVVFHQGCAETWFHSWIGISGVWQHVIVMRGRFGTQVNMVPDLDIMVRSGCQHKKSELSISGRWAPCTSILSGGSSHVSYSWRHERQTGNHQTQRSRQTNLASSRPCTQQMLINLACNQIHQIAADSLQWQMTRRQIRIFVGLLHCLQLFH